MSPRDRPMWYRLDGHEAVPISEREDYLRTVDQQIRHPQRVGLTFLLQDGGSPPAEGAPRFCISTVFLHLDHNWNAGPPILFETMIFDQGKSVFCGRTSTWEEAERAHEGAVALARRAATMSASIDDAMNPHLN